MMSTWFSLLLRPVPWTAAPKNMFPTVATPIAQTCLTLILVRALTQTLLYCPLRVGYVNILLYLAAEVVRAEMFPLLKVC